MEITPGPICWLLVLFAVRVSSWRQPWGSQQGTRWLVLTSWQLGQTCQWATQRQVVEVQELRYRQQEQVSMYDLWAEKIVGRGREASH